MSKVYNVNNGDQIPSIEYIDELMKMIEDALISINNNFSGFPSINIKAEDLPINTNKQDIIYANSIKTDPEHRFINEAILTTLINKPSKLEVEQSLSKTKQDVEDKVTEIYKKIVNTPDVLNKLRDISTIINDNNTFNGLISAISNKTSIEKFTEHTKSSIHMNNNDRKALNILLKCILSGFVDWDAKDGEYNAIKNKPTSLPADGGNADTVANHDIRDLINIDDYSLVIGTSSEKYSEDACDIYVQNGNIPSKILTLSLSSLINGGIILFKQGKYTTDFININNDNIVKGTDRRLVSIKTNDYININKGVVKDINFTDSKIYINSDSEINNTSFTNCEIIIKNSIASTIMNCVFDNCTITINGNMMNNIIKFNRYIKTKPIQHVGGNNIISENI